jgi:hypothetical protein
VHGQEQWKLRTRSNTAVNISVPLGCNISTHRTSKKLHRVDTVLYMFLDYLTTRFQLHIPYSVEWQATVNDRGGRPQEANVWQYEALSQQLSGGATENGKSKDSSSPERGLPTTKQD